MTVTVTNPAGAARVSTAKLIARYTAAGLIHKLGLARHQARVDAAPWHDPSWRDFPVFQVVPGAARPEGGGQGHQQGGGLYRRQSIAIYVYWRCALDAYQDSEELLTRDGEGLLDLFERVREAFALTYFGDGETFLLTEPLRWDGEGETAWVSPEHGIVRRSLSLSGAYITPPPTEVSLNLGDVA